MAKEILDAPEDPWGPKFAKHYDQSARDRFSIYPELHLLVRQALLARLGPDAEILMLGCGSGEEIVQAATNKPQWLFVGVDSSEAMLQHAKTRIEHAGVSDRCTLIHSTLADSPDQIYDGATAILVTHFMPDDDSPDSKSAAAKNLYSRLKPDAPLVVANLLGQLNDAKFEREYELWRSVVLSTVEDLPRWEKNFDAVREMVQWITVERELEIWKSAGFEMDCCLLRWLPMRAWLFKRK